MSFNDMAKRKPDTTGLILKPEYIGTKVYSKVLNIDIRVEDSYWKFDFYISAGLQHIFQ